MYTLKKILVPTDFSQYSDAAVEKAVDLAVQHHAKVIILHVIEENIKQCALDYYVDYCLSDDFVTQFEREITKASNERLMKQVNALKDTKKVNIEFEIKKGLPADVILDEQGKKGADLIVIASHGKTGSHNYPMGSVADKVVRSAKCPVMVDRT
jgi:nucleotide-binding universal stress UspA family protein